jgi:hypothetical protein
MGLCHQMQVPSTLKETFINWRTFPFVEEASIDVLLLHIFANCLRNKKRVWNRNVHRSNNSPSKETGIKKKGVVGCKCKDLVIFVSNHEEHLSQKGEKKNRKEIKKLLYTRKDFLTWTLAISSFSKTNFLLWVWKFINIRASPPVLSMSLWIIKLNV